MARSVVLKGLAATLVLLASTLLVVALFSARERSSPLSATSTSTGGIQFPQFGRKLQEAADPADDAAVVPIETACPLDADGVPTNGCASANGLTKVCCITPDSCGHNDAAGGPTCANGMYYLFTPTTFRLISKDALCPVCQGAPSNPCFSSYGDTKVCCQNPDSCDPATGPAMCAAGDYVTFEGTFTEPIPIGC